LSANRTRAKAIRQKATWHALDDIFYHTRQVAARIAKFVFEMHLDPPIHVWGKGRSYGVGIVVRFETTMVVSYIDSSLSPLRYL